MERFGFVGLPNAGKSSLYNALAGGGALAAPYAFATVEPNVGVAKVPDTRLDQLAAISQSKSVVPAAVQFVDIAGLVEGAAQGEGLGNRFLSHIREVDAIVFVLRAFEDADVPGSHDPVEQLGTLEVELVYADLESVEKQIEKRRKAARADKTLADEVAAMDAAMAHLQAGTPLYRSDLSAEQRALLKPFFLLTAKPAMALVNLDEGQLEDPEPLLEPVRQAMGTIAGVPAQDTVVGLCIQLEAEAARWIKADGNRKPVVGFIAGETAPKGRTMGHAGAIVGGSDDTAQSKKAILRECGVHVVDSPAHIGKRMAELFGVKA